MKRLVFLTSNPPAIYKRGDRVCLTREDWHDIHLRQFEDTPKVRDVGIIRWCNKDGCMIDWGDGSNLNSEHFWPHKEIELAGPDDRIKSSKPKKEEIAAAEFPYEEG
jgi:hypothetical protein